MKPTCPGFSLHSQSLRITFQKWKVKLSPADDRMGSGQQWVGYEFPSTSTCTELTTKRHTVLSLSLSLSCGHYKKLWTTENRGEAQQLLGWPTVAQPKLKIFYEHKCYWVPPFPQIDIIGAVVIVWRVRGKTIRSVLCNIVCNNCAQCNAHTYEQTNSSLDWVLSHWAHLTVLRFIFVLCITVCCMHA